MGTTDRTRRRHRASGLLAILAVPLLGAGGPPPHLELDRTLPAQGATVAAVPEIRLWFKEAPMEMGARSVTLRILDGAGKVIATGNAVRDREDRKVYGIALPRSLPPGAFTVGWKAMAQDGDPVEGEFSFIVAGP